MPSWPCSRQPATRTSVSNTTKKFLTSPSLASSSCKPSAPFLVVACGSTYFFFFFFFFSRTAIDIKNRKLTILAPNQGSLAGRKAIIGSFEWQDQ
jgi:hypothetical protein